ncbi:MAG TPA: outer membrane beta-barrel protein [Chryseolinea sp.]|nr:outer membrane beta-barrel protein [Chryseolinea sp.]
MRLRYCITGFVFFYVSIIGAVAQEANEVTLNMAVEEFNTGHFTGVPELLSPYLNTKQSREWRQRAYLLLTQTYLLLEDPIAAKNSYLKVLEANPEYVPNPALDPTDLVYFGSKFTTAPVFSIFTYGGANTSQVRVIRNNSAVTSDLDKDPIKIKYAQRVGYQFGLGAEWHYDENLSLNAELNYIHTAFKKTTSKAFKQDVVEVIDRQNWLRLPISIKFSDHVGKYRPYGYIGLSLDYLVNDNGAFTTINNDSLKSDSAPINSQRVESSKQNFTPRRYRFNNSFFVGGGLKYKVGFNYVFVDVRYSLGMRNIVSKEDFYYRYDNGSMTSDEFLETGNSTFDFGHVDDFFRMNNIVLSIGFVHPLYKPRELKHGKSKSILKKIKKQDEKL